MNAIRNNGFSQLTAVAIGHVTHDRFGDKIVPGGSAYYGAHTFNALGAKTKILSAVGTDFRYQQDLAEMDVVWKIGNHTTTFSNLYADEKPRVQFVEQQASPITSEDYPNTWSQPDLLFMAPVMGEIADMSLVSTAKPKLATCGLQGYLKQAGDTNSLGKRIVIALQHELDLDFLTGVEAVFLSQEDIELFADPHLFERLTKKVARLFVTDGTRGCLLYDGQGKHHLGVFETKALDPTGAGDTFAAATSLALAAGWSTLEAARFGSAAASIVVEAEGGANLSVLSHQTFERYRALRARSNRHIDT